MNSEYMSTAKTESAQVQIPPDNIPDPAFQIGVSRARWKLISSSDWGLVMGMRYLWAEHLAGWQWQYYVVLDPNSPSWQWTQSDWGWQDDLEFLPISDSVKPLLYRESDQL